MTYVEVAIAKQHTSGALYTYQCDTDIQVGDIVAVPFGRKDVNGIVVAIVKKPTFATKPVTRITPYRLPAASIQLMQWMFDFYPEDNGVITQLFIPPSITTAPKKQTAKLATGKGLPLPPPTKEQKNALQIIQDSVNTRVLLHGDTGTGKTRVFVDQTEQMLRSGKSVLILTPEIGLTPQLVSDIEQHVTAPIITTHSNLTPVQRRCIFEHALQNTVPTVYVGPRSALFLPMQNLGLIVIDEAHDSSYKQGQSPRYQANHVAAKLANIHNAQLISSTATPNIDEYEIAKKLGYAIIRLKTPAAGTQKHQAHIIDLTNRDLFKASPYLADEIVNGIKSALQNKQQSMVFLNRRGSARLVQCAACGWQALCPKCGLPLTYHHDAYTLRCHTCSFQQTAPSSCPSCGGTELKF